MLKIEATLSRETVIPWLELALKTMTAAKKFSQDFYHFRARRAYSPLRNDGTIDQKSPCYRILSEGTQEEADAGMFVTAPVVGSRFSSVTPWSLMPFGDVPIVAHECTYIDATPVSDHARYAVESIVQELNVEPAKYIFASRDMHGDCADFFFHVWNDVDNLYIRVTVNARYSNVRVYGFQGDPIAFAVTTVRTMRVSEWGLRQDGSIPVQTCPTTLPMEYRYGEWHNKRAVTLADVMAATQCLKRMPNERDEPYLVG